VKNPAHPGRIVGSACLAPLRLSVTEGAKVLGVTRQTLTKIVNGKSGSSAQIWLRMQAAYDLAQARKEESQIKVRRQYMPQEVRAE